MIVNKATKEDLMSCSKVIERAIDNIPSYLHSEKTIVSLKGASEIKKLEKEIEKGSLMICKTDEIVIGVGAITERYINKLFVDPDFQGKGAGKSIMTCLENMAKSEGFSATYLNSTKNAVHFYEKLGYKKADTNNLDYTFMIKQ